MDLIWIVQVMAGIVEWDQWMFLSINGWENAFLDQIVPLYRHKLFWIPFYVFIVSFLVKNFPKNGLWMVLFAVITIGISDTASSQWIKKSVQRLRPCNDNTISKQVELRVRCGGGYSFTSSHATNHTALAFYLIILFQGMRKWWGWLLILWALSVGWSQIYVGVHYPLDVLAGSVLGAVIGTMLAWLYQTRFTLD
ncbi:MAG: phosphatase PAP2 family protein [Saprospiraceae bacterium]|nr:phosphatase PAP2 family protein [Saprospiraceae bacterium]